MHVLYNLNPVLWEGWESTLLSSLETRKGATDIWAGPSALSGSLRCAHQPQHMRPAGSLWRDSKRMKAREQAALLACLFLGLCSWQTQALDGAASHKRWIIITSISYPTDAIKVLAKVTDWKV